MVPSTPDHPPSPASARSSSTHYWLWLAFLLLFVLLILVNWVVNHVLRGDAVTYWRVQEFLFGLAGPRDAQRDYSKRAEEDSGP